MQARKTAGKWFSILRVGVLTTVTITAPLQSIPSEPAGCVDCHAAETVLPPGHVLTEKMDANACHDCHKNNSPLALQTKMPLSHFHRLNGVTCEACHESVEQAQRLSTEQCLACHGPLEELAARSADVEPHNPHSSPHGPAYAECDLCHQVHQPSENFCADCHDFDYVVP